MSYDVSISISQNQLDALGVSIYNKINSSLKGEENINFGGSAINVTWSINKPPVFDLVAQANFLQTHKDSVLAEIYDPVLKSELSAIINDAGKLNAFLDDNSLFLMNLDNISIMYSGGGVQGGGSNLSAITLCKMAVGPDGSLTFSAQSIGITTDDAVLKFFVQKRLKEVSDQLLQGIKAPPLALSGVSLGRALIGIRNSNLVAAASLNGSQADLSQAPTVGNGFFLSLSTNVIKFFADGWINSNKDIHSGDATIHLNGCDVQVDQGGVNLNIYMNGDVYISMGPAGDAHWSIDLSGPVQASLSLSINGTQVHMTPTNIRKPGISVNPRNFGAGLMSGLSLGIVDGIIDSIVSSSLSGQTSNQLNRDIFAIPQFTETVNNIIFCAVPDQLSIVTIPGYANVTGNLTII